MLSFVKFKTAACGCLIGKYQDTVTGRETACVEVSVSPCGVDHRRNDLLAPVRSRQPLRAAS
jgi:hypothetical protein